MITVHQSSSVSGEKWHDVAVSVFMHTQKIQGTPYYSGPSTNSLSVPLKGLLVTHYTEISKVKDGTCSCCFYSNILMFAVAILTSRCADRSIELEVISRKGHC